MRAQTVLGHDVRKGDHAALVNIGVAMFRDSAVARTAEHTTADSAGNFYLDALGPGKYRLAFVTDTIVLGLTIVTLAKDSVVQRELEVDPSQQTRIKSDVEKEVTPIPPIERPAYPSSMRTTFMEG